MLLNWVTEPTMAPILLLSPRTWSKRLSSAWSFSELTIRTMLVKAVLFTFCLDKKMINIWPLITSCFTSHGNYVSMSPSILIILVVSSSFHWWSVSWILNCGAEGAYQWWPSNLHYIIIQLSRLFLHSFFVLRLSPFQL